MRFAVRLWLLLVACFAFALPARAAAWVESTVISDAVTVQFERNGRALVSHATTLRVRGGPLKNWTLQGVDRDAEPVSDAYVVSTSSEKANSRKELILARGDDESLQLDVADDKGLRQGTYLLQFSYRTDFRVTKMVRPRGGWLELAWVGARFPTGLDGAKTTFRIPAAPTPPRAAESEAEPNSIDDQATPVDSFVSTVRRGADFDEVELIRAHVAQGEPVLWRVWANPAAFDASIIPGASERIELDAPVASPAKHEGRGLVWLVVAGLTALGWIAAFTLKLRLHSDDCAAQGVQPRALIPLSPVLRGALSAALVASAILLAWSIESPNAAVACGIGALLLACQRSPRDRRELRGPGVWLPLTDAEAFARERPIVRARFFDASMWQGRVALTAFLVIVGIAVCIISRFAAYDGVLLAFLAPAPLAFFVTALSSQLPHARAQRKRAWLSALRKRLARAAQIKVVALARFPEGEVAPDDLRLRVMGQNAVEGLLGIEVAYGEFDENQLATASLIIRVKEGSPAQRVWQHLLVWQRGRRADERVAIYDVSWPLVSLTTDAIMNLLNDLNAQRSSDACIPRARSTVSRSSGSGSIQSKGGKPPSPPQAIRRA
jgi:hypothetical protein